MDEKKMAQEAQKMTAETKMEEIPAEILDMIMGGDGNPPTYTCRYCGQTFRTITSAACHASTCRGK